MTSFTGELEKAGYFQGLPPDKFQSLKNYFDKHGWDAIFSDSHRLFHADAEDLAEGGIGTFIRELQPFLSAQGVHALEITDEVSDEGYFVHLNDREYKIYDAEELKETEEDKPGHTWALAMTRGFRIINELLAAAGSQERIYAVNGGNDLFGLFLTPEQFRIIMAHPDASPKDAPYEPDEEYPWYGASQEGRKGDVPRSVGSASASAKPGFSRWPLWKQLVAAFLLGCVLLALKLLLFKK